MTITLYSKPNCPQCDATVRILDKLELVYTKIDVTLDEAARQIVAALGYIAAPVVVAGAEHWSGFRPERLRALVL